VIDVFLAGEEDNSIPENALEREVGDRGGELCNTDMWLVTNEGGVGVHSCIVIDNSKLNIDNFDCNT
jgi:hypothetical protein